MRASKQQLKQYQMNLDGEAEKVAQAERHHPEEKYQILLFARRDDLQGQYPGLGWMFATLNGVYLPDAIKKRVKDSGLTKGVLDIWMPLRREDEDGKIWSGVAIDLKRIKDGSPSTEQLDWARILVANGWRVYFCAGVVDAWRVIACYLDIAGRDHWAADLQGQERYVQLTENDL